MRKRVMTLGFTLQLLTIPALLPAQSTVDIDFTGDGVVNFFDFVEFAVGFGNLDLKVDLDGNGDVNFFDFVAFAVEFGKPPKETVTYEVIFEGKWSQETHPEDFPIFRNYFSDLVGATHDSDVVFWQPGGLATPGIKQMAELGFTNKLRAEVEVAMEAGTAEFHLPEELQLLEMSMERSPGLLSMTFEITESHPLVTLVTMIAPSPDWFVGVSGLNLFPEGTWLDTLAVDLFAYDAGTDSGVTFETDDVVTDPPQPIKKIQSSPLPGGSPPLGTLTFVRQ